MEKFTTALPNSPRMSRHETVCRRIPLPTSNGVDLLVLKEDVDSARQVLEEAQKGG
jgi:hypothetical protein